MEKPWMVEYANWSRAKVEQCLFEAQVDFPNFSTELNLYVAPLGSYDIIIGINWLSEHKAKVDCLARTVQCVDDQGRLTSISGIRHEIKAKQISAMQLKKYGRKGCEIYAVQVEDTRITMYGDEHIYEDGEINRQLRESFEENYPYLKDYQDVFPEELPGLPPTRAFDFSIDFVLGAKPISRAPYRMTTTELMEL